MQNLLILGAGRSTYFLITNLVTEARKHDWQITVADLYQAQLDTVLEGHDQVQGQQINLQDADERCKLIRGYDVVISMLPAHMHPEIGRDCLAENAHLLTASYLSEEMKALHEEAAQKGLLFLNELGLDPGIDHMSAKQVIDRLKNAGATIKGFHSHTGGLVAPESDDNPWHYKISWSPMNVVKAGQTWAQAKVNGKHKIIPYQQLFKRLETIEIPGYGSFEGYFNRNSLQYQDVYELQDADTVVRGTLRKPGFCQSWDLLVQTGLTNDDFTLDLEGHTYRQFVDMFLPERAGMGTREKLADFLQIDPDSEAFERMEWLGLLEDEPIPEKRASPAEVMTHLLSRKWQMKPSDKDLIVMVHRFDYELNGQFHQLKSYLTLEGVDAQKTAMAKTVGLPLAVAARLLMQREIELSGVHIPVQKALYEPLLNALQEYGIEFREEEG